MTESLRSANGRTYANGTPNGADGTKNPNGSANGAINGSAANGSSMPTGIYGAVDVVRGTTAPPAAPTAPAPRPIADFPVETDVPSAVGELPRSRSLRLQWRFLRVLFFAGWLFVRLMFWQVYARRYFPGYVERTNLARFTRYAREFRGFAIALGGVFIKLGQFISTRVDALPEEVVRELESLQDEVPDVPFRKVRGVLERELGPIDNNYAWFNEQPIAAASLGQAHRAKLKNGDRVVVKVQRPGIRQICYTDLAAVQIVARIAMRFSFISRRADAVALNEEFGRVLLEELSYNHEARNAARFAQMFKDDMGVYIPTIYPEYSTDQVLTIEDVTSLKITDFAALEAAGISRKEVAERLMETYLEQIFEHFFFHADPHPGNLFIYPLPVDDARLQQYIARGGGRPFYLIFIDFGMTGTLTREIADGMVNTLAAVIARDPVKLVESYQRLGFLLPNADKARIIEATKAAFDEVWGMSLTEIRDMDYQRAANLANEFSDLIKSMPFYLPQDFIYLGRTVSILSGMSTSLDSNFNPWHELEPYAQRLAAQGFGINVNLGSGEITPAGVFESLFNGNGGEAIRQIGSELIRRTAPLSPTTQILHEIREGGIRVTAEPGYAYKAQLKRLEAQTVKTNRAVIFGSVLIASTVLYTGGEATLGLIGYGFCGLSALYGFLKG